MIDSNPRQNNRMKQAIHPNSHQILVTCSCGNKMTITSTLSEDFSVETCSACHPQYTGKKRELKAGRVERFKQKYGASMSPKAKAKTEDSTETK